MIIISTLLMHAHNNIGIKLIIFVNDSLKMSQKKFSVKFFNFSDEEK